MDKIIEVTGLKKAYKDVQAVRGVDFYAERGKLFALLGPTARQGIANGKHHKRRFQGF
ncbi:MAG: hypothetical protein GX810_05090 [Clostridiales bacterium]|nr:hypothetical protein [Clostridiales bacterium]